MDEIIKTFYTYLDCNNFTIDELSHIRFNESDYHCIGEFRGYEPFKAELTAIAELLLLKLPSLGKEGIYILKERLLNFLERKETFVADGNSFILQKDFEIEEIDPDGKVVPHNITDLDSYTLTQLQKYWQLKESICLMLIENMEKIPVISTQPEVIDKLELKLSVPDIALLFRLLDEVNLIQYKHRTEIYNHIANSLKTVNQENISVSSIKNKFLSPDNTAIKNIDALLVNLRQVLKKIQ